MRYQGRYVGTIDLSISSVSHKAFFRQNRIMKNIPKVDDPGAWRWVLIALLGLERLSAHYAFPLNDRWRTAEPWEFTFALFWTWFGLLPLVLVFFKKRSGGWWCGLSTTLLLVRTCIPLAGEYPATGAVWVLFPIALSMTFIFLYDQSFWDTDSR